jgi:hypothetical protein
MGMFANTPLCVHLVVDYVNHLPIRRQLANGVARAPNPRDVGYADPDEAVDRPGPAPSPGPSAGLMDGLHVKPRTTPEDAVFSSAR